MLYQASQVWNALRVTAVRYLLTVHRKLRRIGAAAEAAAVAPAVTPGIMNRIRDEIFSLLNFSSLM